MSSDFLPQGTTLGKLTMVEVYNLYDCPQLFCCRNEKQKLFLAVFSDSTEDTDTFFYVELSKRRFNLLTAGIISLHTAFKRAESGVVFYAGTSSVTGETTVTEVDCTKIHDDDLPARGESLKAKSNVNENN